MKKASSCLTPTGIGHHASTVKFVTSLSAFRLFACRPIVSVVALTLEGLRDAAAVLAVGAILADRAIMAAPAGMADAHARHDAVTVNAIANDKAMPRLELIGIGLM